MGVFVGYPMVTGVANPLELVGIGVRGDLVWGRRLYLTCVAAAMAVRVETGCSPQKEI